MIIFFFESNPYFDFLNSPIFFKTMIKKCFLSEFVYEKMDEKNKKYSKI